MLELPDKQGASPRRLVLGFDAGCVTCSDLASRIEERVGDKLEVRSLHHPQVEHWRKQALGEDAPWAPTLFEVGGVSGLRAWTGASMAVRLTRALGPVSMWRVMQALGEVGARSAVDTTTIGSSTVGMAATGTSRGQFLKGVGGAAIAFGFLSGVASPARADENEMAVAELEEVFSAIEQIPQSVLKQGDRAANEWLRDRLLGDSQPGTVQPQTFWGCVYNIGLALASNALPVAKILKIRAAIKAIGGVRNFVITLQAAYNYAIRRGYSRWGAIQFAARRAARVSGVDVVGALLGLFSLRGVVVECF